MELMEMFADKLEMIMRKLHTSFPALSGLKRFEWL